MLDKPVAYSARGTGVEAVTAEWSTSSMSDSSRLTPRLLALLAAMQYWSLFNNRQ